jgi:uncharacterized radical SAM protein YgiQ
MTPKEVRARGWDAVDVVFVTGDAYVDHPSFAMALLGRLLESEGYRVAILSQPDWHSCEPWRAFGRPRICFAVSAGNMDSMVNHYTAARKVRNDDAYSPAGQIGRRPDRATLAYCQRAREAFSQEGGVPIIAGGVEASLRRIAHYDYWSDKVRRSILLDAKADLLVYGMGERALAEIVRRLNAGQTVQQLRDLRGGVYRLGASASLSLRERAGVRADSEHLALDPTDPSPGPQTPHPNPLPAGEGTQRSGLPEGEGTWDTLVLPSFEEVSRDKRAFAEMTRLAHRETNPYNARRLVQYHGREAVVVNPPALPLTEAEMDRVYGLPYTRRPHPSYGDRPIPAFQVVRDSVQIMRGCFGGCTFCSITAHEGRVIQSRSRASVLAEIRRMADGPDFKGTVSDIGGPTANMYRMNCSRPDVRAKCRRLSCVHPTICKLLATDHGPLIELMKEARRQPGVKRVLVASGIRMDLAQRSTAYLSHLVRHHVGGHLKVAPEHSDPDVLRLMKKPPIEDFERFARKFTRASRQAGKQQYLIPYFIAGHPGCDLAAMIDLALFLKRTGYRVEQVQDFIPGPFDIATCMYHTGIDPMTGQQVYVARGARERRLQRALLQYWNPESYFDVREALQTAGRSDLIGDGPECFIPARPPQGARQAKGRHGERPRRNAKQPPAPASGYRPHRKSAREPPET